MTSVLLPPVPYDQTSIRPQWHELPLGLRAALERRLGAEVIQAIVSGAGFTSGFAAVLITADGARHFVKAAPSGSPAASWYEREALLTFKLPRGVPTKRPHWAGQLTVNPPPPPAAPNRDQLTVDPPSAPSGPNTDRVTANPRPSPASASTEHAGYFVMFAEAIDGARTPSLPWLPADLTAALDALASTAAALANPPAALLALDPAPWSHTLERALSHWRSPQPPWHPHRAELADLEQRFDELTGDAPTLIHCDLRLDNVVIDSSGRAWICDWNHLCFGPPWFDTMSLLLSAEAGGQDADALFYGHPTAMGLPADALDCGLAALAGYYCHAGSQPEIETSPNVRAHQRYSATVTLRWLARRRGWAAAA